MIIINEGIGLINCYLIADYITSNILINQLYTDHVRDIIYC